MSHEPLVGGVDERAMEAAGIVPQLINMLEERQRDYMDGGRFDTVRQGLAEDLDAARRQIELLTTKQTIAENNFRIDSEEVEHKQRQRGTQFLAQNPDLLARHEQRIDELLRSLGILGIQLRRIAERIAQYETLTEQLQAKIDACDVQKNQFRELAMGQAALLLQQLQAVEPIDIFAGEGVEVANDDLFDGIVERPASLAGDRIIIDITSQSMKERSVPPLTLRAADSDDAQTETLRTIGVRIPQVDAEGLFGK